MEMVPQMRLNIRRAFDFDFAHRTSDLIKRFDDNLRIESTVVPAGLASAKLQGTRSVLLCALQIYVPAFAPRTLIGEN